MSISIVNYQQPPVTDGLIRFYDPQIEMSTGSILEQSGRGAAAGSGNGYSITTTEPAYVTFINNATNRFTVPAATDLDWTDGTVVAWVYLNGSAAINYCFANQRSGLTTNTRYSLHLNPSGNTLGIYNGTAFTTLSTTIDSGIWYCLAATLSTTINTTFYKNGISVGTIASSTIRGATTGKTFEFGNSDSGFINESLAGRIGQVWNYSRRLTAEEINQIYQRTRDRYGLFI